MNPVGFQNTQGNARLSILSLAPTFSAPFAKPGS